MESRWGFKFENIEQMDELLHIGFVNDEREIPPEISEDTLIAVATTSNKGKNSKSKEIANLIQKWASLKDASGEIKVCNDKCNTTYCSSVSKNLFGDVEDAVPYKCINEE